MNALFLEIKKTVTFPKTMQSFLKLLEKPVNDYCPPKWIPSEFDGEFGLLDMGDLSEEANDYLTEVLLAKEGSLQAASTIFKQLAIDNQKFTRILDKLREAYSEDNPRKGTGSLYKISSIYYRTSIRYGKRNRQGVSTYKIYFS